MLRKTNSKHNLIFSVFYFVFCSFILTNFNGTGAEADSLTHYLFAKWAPFHPEIYLDHWAKPVFTLLSSPFAQFGFTGIKIFNCICVYFTCLLLIQLAKKFRLKWYGLSALFYIIFPVSFVTGFSGLTEPLCALFLTGSIYLFHRKKYMLASLLISFTPFIRSEGLLFIGVFALFFFSMKNRKAFITLISGHLIFSIIGFFYYGDFLWVFNKIPYAHLSSHYGSGGLFHFAEKLIYLMGIPLLIFFLLGIIRFFVQWKQQSDTLKLIVACFLCFFIAHSLFWYLEIFNSMGLKRVFAAVSPLMAFLCLYGFNLIEEDRSKWRRRLLAQASIIIIFLFPFTSNPAAVEWEDLFLSEAQQNAQRIEPFLKKQELKIKRYVYTDPYVSELLDIDPFDSEKKLTLAENTLNEIQAGDLIIWDNWHSIVDYRVDSSNLSTYKELTTFEKGKSVYKIYYFPHE